MRYKRFFNYFNTFINVINYFNNFNKRNVNCFNKYLWKTFTSVNIINYLNKFKIDITIRIIEINIYKYLFFFIIEDIKLIANNEQHIFTYQITLRIEYS